MVKVGLKLVLHIITVGGMVITLHYKYLLVAHQKEAFISVVVILLPLLLLYNGSFLELFVSHPIIVTFYSNNRDSYNTTPTIEEHF